MYSKQEASQLRQDFWTRFGLYMAPVLSAGGEQINWVNYKTGNRHISFRMDADGKSAGIAVVLRHSDPAIRELFYDQLLELKNMFHSTAGMDWNWLRAYNDRGAVVSKVEKRLEGVSVFRQEDWPALISFFKQHIIALDEFWSNARYAFEVLE
jgi:hypothetical protein